DAPLVRSDEDTAPLKLAQLTHRALRLFGETLQPFRIIPQHPPGFSERAVLRRAIEQPLPHRFLEAADGLADRRLSSMQLRGGAREAALGRNCKKHTEFSQVHLLVPYASRRSRRAIL